MAQHFLLSSAAKTLSVASVARMSEEEARATFQRIRWADNNGEAYCPKCGSTEAKAHKNRPVWRCKGCDHQYSVSSGTIFASRKLAMRDYLLAIAMFVNGAKGVSALQISRDMQVQYKTAYVLCHKLREAMASGLNGMKAKGEVEIDGAYFGGYVKPANFKAHRIDRRTAMARTGKRQVVVIMRERDGNTIPVVAKSESEAIPAIKANVAESATVYADDASAWDQLHARYNTKRINHSIAYSDAGACTNQAESFFSRLRRAEVGTHHKIAGPYLLSYADEMAWREDHRRVSNGDQFNAITVAALAHPKSKAWAGYWQRAWK